ncbi:hypothetical protein C0971_16235 [Bacillus methanolicus]|uniref:bifunctional DNA primase/polymerase n=1 Tax=Bacillus methanolicus TaxID=1471 RepID=UPI00201011F1|nr:bifunctional DNA primase/polymerase [Bacillus methanolicus]UQD53395.1 hypothetical protein C0971_16235 [Bacillus methanolicus]
MNVTPQHNHDYVTKSALQLHEFGLTTQPLNGKRPLLKNWSTRFIQSPLTKNDIINGIQNDNGKLITFKNQNIGILTGKVSNCIVVDFDCMETYQKLEQKYGPFPRTWTVESSRGRHLYFNYDETIASCTPIPHVDILSDKKQVVAPPSIHPSGKKYKWLISPKDVQKANLPDWLVEIIHDQKKIKTENKSKYSSTLYKKKRQIVTNDLDYLASSVNWVNFYARYTDNWKDSEEYISCTCPFHDDETNSFSFHKEHGGWICFSGCGSGNGFQAIQRIYDISFSQAIKLAKGEQLYV